MIGSSARQRTRLSSRNREQGAVREMEIGGRAPWARWSGAGRDFGWPNLNKVGRAEENRHGYREPARQGRASSAEAERHGSLGKERVEGDREDARGSHSADRASGTRRRPWTELCFKTPWEGQRRTRALEHGWRGRSRVRHQGTAQERATQGMNAGELRG